MKTVTIHEAEANRARLIERAEKGEEIVIARDDRPVVRLVVVEERPKAEGEREPGMFAEVGSV